MSLSGLSVSCRLVMKPSQPHLEHHYTWWQSSGSKLTFSGWSDVKQGSVVWQEVALVGRIHQRVPDVETALAAEIGCAMLHTHTNTHTTNIHTQLDIIYQTPRKSKLNQYVTISLNTDDRRQQHYKLFIKKNYSSTDNTLLFQVQHIPMTQINNHARR